MGAAENDDKTTSVDLARDTLETPRLAEPDPNRPAHGAALYATSIDLSDDNDSHTLVVRMVGSGKRVLELGCATGSTTKFFKERGCRVTAIEIDPEAAEHAREWADEVIVGDLDTIDIGDVLGDAQFDVIVAADVLEHLKDPRRCLDDCLEKLAPHGEVVMSVPNVAHVDVRMSLFNGRFDYQWAGLLDETHLRFFTRTSLERFLDESQLAVLEWATVTRDPGETEIAWDDSVDPEIVAQVLSQADADTYQFVLRVALAPEGSHLREVARQRDTTRRELEEKQRQLDDELEETKRVTASLVATQRENERLLAQNPSTEAELASLRSALSDARASIAAERRQRDEYKASFVALADVHDELVAVRRSESYRLGHAALMPFIAGRRILRAWRQAER